MSDNHQPADGSPFAWVHVGDVITRFGEKAARVHHARFADPAPAWFQPRTNPGHGAQHRDGYSIYWAVKVNQEARATAHPFDERVKSNAIHITQLTLL